MDFNAQRPPPGIWDFIVCGGGTSGCVVAGRLAEDPNISVLVIEAGPHSENIETVHMVGGWSQNFDKETDWNIVTVPGSGINDRQVKLSRGKFLGGSSGCNGTLCIRGSKQDFDDWQIPGWSGEEVFKYMRKAESFKGKPWFNAEKDGHGFDGPLGIEPHDLAPISELFIKSMESKGLPHDQDMFTHGNTANGCGNCPRTVRNGLRTTAADYITRGNRKGNVNILTEAHVDKVYIEKDLETGELKATGVKAVLACGTVFEAKALKEVIVSGGSYCSPNILNRSGIGAKAELKEHGITTLVDAPSVGKNLNDHVVAIIYYETDKPGITNDHLVYHGDSFQKTYKLWKEENKGFLSTYPFGTFAYARLDERLADSEVWKSAPRRDDRDPMGLTRSQPHIELWNTELYGGPKQYTDFPGDGQYAFAMIVELFSGQSRGTVKLRDADAKAIPLVDCGYLTNPLDLEVLAEGCRFGNEIVMDGEGTKDIVKGAWPPGEQHHKFSTREDWFPFIKENATTCYHGSGTCAMGKDSDEKAVVDERLRVKGVKRLRVVDVSIMPSLHGGHTQMPAYAIGEKAADMIKEDWAF